MAQMEQIVQSIILVHDSVFQVYDMLIKTEVSIAKILPITP